MKNKNKNITLIFVDFSLLLMVFGYLNSSKANTIFLNDNQLLSNNKGKAQMFKTVAPLVVEKDHLEINQKGTAFISSSDIKGEIEEIVEKKLQANEMCYKYIPKGVDIETIEKVIEFKIYENDSKILTALIQYEKDLKQAQNQLGEQKLSEWIKKKK